MHTSVSMFFLLFQYFAHAIHPSSERLCIDCWNTELSRMVGESLDAHHLSGFGKAVILAPHLSSTDFADSGICFNPRNHHANCSSSRRQQITRFFSKSWFHRPPYTPMSISTLQKHCSESSPVLWWFRPSLFKASSTPADLRSAMVFHQVCSQLQFYVWTLTLVSVCTMTWTAIFPSYSLSVGLLFFSDSIIRACSLFVPSGLWRCVGDCTRDFKNARVGWGSHERHITDAVASPFQPFWDWKLFCGRCVQNGCVIHLIEIFLFK